MPKKQNELPFSISNIARCKVNVFSYFSLIRLELLVLIITAICCYLPGRKFHSISIGTGNRAIKALRIPQMANRWVEGKVEESLSKVQV